MCRALLFVWLCSFAGAAGGTNIPDQIDGILSRSAVAGNSWTILIENKDGSVIYYQRNPTTGLAPASNTKLFTSSAAFGLLGTNYAFQSRVYYNGTLAGGILTGDLNLVSEHDITWNTTVFSASARAPLDHIAAQLKAKGLTTISGNVQCYGLCVYNLTSGDSLSSYSTQTLNSNAATAFVAALAAQGITVSGTAVGQTGFSPPGVLYYTHLSSDLTYGGKPLRLDIACNPMLKVSHNVMADGLCRHLGWKLSGTDSYTAGAGQVVPWLKNAAGLSTNGIVMNDGSGLSHGNSFSARQCVSLNRYMLGAYYSWGVCLPIGCVDGTISSRFCGTDGSGQVHAKTGSLSISIALSGYVDNKYDNQRYLFSFIGNQASIDQASTRQAIDDCVVLMAARGVPISPSINAVVGNSNGNSITVTWLDQKFVRTGYKIYSSADGLAFGSAITVASNAQSYAISNLALGTKRYFRLTVVSSGGESKFSRTYGASAGSLKRALIVDDDDRWQFQTTENPTCTNHAFCAIAGQNIYGVNFDTAAHQSVIDGTVSLTNYSAVIWLCGEQSTSDHTFSATEQSLVGNYLNQGGNLFVSGSEIGWDLDRDSGPAAADRVFFHTYLKAALNGNVNDDANTYSFGPVANGIFGSNPASGFDNGTHGTYNVDFPDVLTLTNGGVASLSYLGGLGGNAGIQYDGSPGGGRLVYFGFPFETIKNSAVRDLCMSKVLRFFGLSVAPTLAGSYDPNAQTTLLSWNSSPGLAYRLQFKSNLMDAAWQNLTSDMVATNTASGFADPVSGVVTSRFYRVVVAN